MGMRFHFSKHTQIGEDINNLIFREVKRNARQFPGTGIRSACTHGRRRRLSLPSSSHSRSHARRRRRRRRARGARAGEPPRIAVALGIGSAVRASAYGRAWAGGA
eukprot:6190482-Pleurochrysis_carterae.AAC.1